MFIHMHQLSDKWNVGEMGCFTNKIIFPTAHYSDKIRTSEMSD